MATQMTRPVPVAALDADTIQAFRESLRGELLTPDDPRYDDARAVRNGLIDRYPALIARCSGTADVVACVNFAREQGLPITVRGGAHNVAGNAVNDGGVVVDLSGMRGVYVDPAERRCAPRGEPPGARSTARRSSLASPCRAGSSPQPASAASPFTAATATCGARTA